MRLAMVDKARYRRHVKQVIVAMIIVLAVGSLAIAQLLIALFPAAEGTHFHWNLTGVVVTALAIFGVLKRYKSHAFMTEVAYVWDLKQALNQVVRKMRKLKSATEAGDVRAFLALQFFYEGSRQLANLDDNTITLDELTEQHMQLIAAAEAKNITLVAEFNAQYLQALR